MARTPDNKPIVAKLAIFKDMTLTEARSAVIGMDRPIFPFLKHNSPIPPAAWIIGPSVPEIYQLVTGREWLFGGPKADIASEQAFRFLQVVPITVPEADFKRLMKIKANADPQKFSHIIQRLFELPLEVSVEK